MSDQAQKLRDLFNSKSLEDADLKNNSCKIITITSGKGGVGKSNIVVNLSLSLRKQGKRVLIFDGDLGMGNDDVLMGIVSKYTIYDCILRSLDIEDIIVEGPLGVKLLPGGSGILRVEDLTEDERRVFLNKLENIKGYDYIIIDTSAGINKSVLAFIACCEELIIVTNSEPTSITDAYSLLKAVNHFKIKSCANVIVNKAETLKEGNETFKKFSGAVEKFLEIKVNFLGAIREDSGISAAVKAQKPIVINSPKSNAAEDILRIAQKIQGIKNNENESLKGMFVKLFNLFK